MKRLGFMFNVTDDVEEDSIVNSLKELGASDIFFVAVKDSLDIGDTQLKFFQTFIGFKRWIGKPKEGIVAYVAATSEDMIIPTVEKVLKRKLVLVKCKEEKKKFKTSNDYMTELTLCDFIEGIE